MARSDATLHVLQGHIHNLHIRDQLKDEQLHDVAVFVKSSLGPLVDEISAEQHKVAQCKKCLWHHRCSNACHSTPARQCSKEADSALIATNGKRRTS